MSHVAQRVKKNWGYIAWNLAWTLNILFVCSRNKKRSLTAETIYRNSNEHHVRSAGTENVARVHVTEKLLQWADIVFVMENKHKQRLEEKFDIAGKRLIVLGIPDEYEYMDSELVQMLESSIKDYV